MTLSDIDECVTGTHRCSKFATCDNTRGSYTCECLPGYIGNGTQCSGRPCRDQVLHTYLLHAQRMHCSTTASVCPT